MHILISSKVNSILRVNFTIYKIIFGLSKLETNNMLRKSMGVGRSLVFGGMIAEHAITHFLSCVMFVRI